MASADTLIHTADGWPLAATVFEPPAEIETRGWIVVCGALAVPRQMVGRFAAWFAARGYGCVTFDCRGAGGSAQAPAQAPSPRFADWGMHDTEAVLRYVRERAPGQRYFLVGNSSGGQLCGLAPSIAQLSGIVFAAVQIAHWRLWPFPSKFAMWGIWHLAVPVVSSLTARFPLRWIGLGDTRMPSGIVGEWARFARRPDYLFDPRFGLDTSRYGALRIPLLSFSFSDDPYAPRAAVDAMATRFAGCTVTRRHLAPQDAGAPQLGHFGFFRPAVEASLWEDTLRWLERC